MISDSRWLAWSERPGRLTHPHALVGAKATVVAVLAAILCLGCNPDTSAYQAAIDGVHFPATWQLADTIERGGAHPCVPVANPYCPSITRYFRVDRTLVEAFQDAKTALVNGGFKVAEEIRPACEIVSADPPCWIEATLDTFTINVQFNPPGVTVDALAPVSDKATVRMVIRHLPQG